MLSLWFYPCWLPSRHSYCPLAPHKRGQKAISFQQTMMWVGARVPLLGFLDSQTECNIIVGDNMYSIITIALGTKWTILFSFLRLIEALSKFRTGTAFKVSKLEIFKLLLLNFETTLPTGISSFVYWFSYLLCLAFFQGFECVYCLSKDDLIAPFLDFETMPIQILKSTFVRNICNLSSEVYRDIEVSFFFKISIPLRSCLVFSYLKWRIISPFARSGDGIFTSIYHANSAPRCPWPQNCENSKKNNVAFISRLSKNRILFLIFIVQ